MNDKIDMSCDACNKKGSQKCNGCRRAQFCSRECLRRAWPQHREECDAGILQTKKKLELLAKKLSPSLNHMKQKRKENGESGRVECLFFRSLHDFCENKCNLITLRFICNAESSDTTTFVFCGGKQIVVEAANTLPNSQLEFDPGTEWTLFLE